MLSLVLVATAAAAVDPPKPQFPGAFTVAWNLTEGKEGASMALVSSGSTELDDAGSGRQRETTVLQRNSQLHPGRTYYFVVDAISDWAAGDSWTRTCTNQTAVELCSCLHTPLSGRIPYSRSPAVSYAGDVLAGGALCHLWQISADIVWAVTVGAAPNLVVQAVLTGPEVSAQDYSGYVLAPPNISRWNVPVEWVRCVLACWHRPWPARPRLGRCVLCAVGLPSSL